MTNAEARIVHLEQELRRDELAIAALQAAIAALQQAVRTGQTSPYGGGGSTGPQPVYWATNAGAVLAATGSTLAGLTPTTFTSNIYCNVSGTLTIQASSQTVYWWYLDALPINSIVAVEPSNSGASWDAIANGCTAL